jgi:hypothetical protein
VKKIPLLPADLYLAQMLGLTEEEYRWFKAEVESRVRIEPGKPQAGIETLIFISIASTLISVGLTIAASFFKPQSQNARPARLKTRTRDGQNITSQSRFAPVAGFDSVQETATLGEVIPVVYANKSAQFGGVRVTMPLLWSDMHSFKAGQFFRGVFMLGEGRIGELDLLGFALGNNGLGAYELTGAAVDYARFSIYFRKNGGRITRDDRVAGKPGSKDPGAWEQGNVYRVRSGSDFCSVSKPTSQTTFGVYTLLGNNFVYRLNPQVRPTITPQLVPEGKKGDAKVKIDKDAIARAAKKKYSAYFSTRSGVIAGSFGSIGDQFTYILDRSSDANTTFNENATNNGGWNKEVKVKENPFIWVRSLKLSGSGVFTGSAISDSEVESWANVNVSGANNGNTVTASLTLNTTKATNQILANTSEGQYRVIYKVKLTTSDSNDDDNQELEFEFEVDFRVDREDKLVNDVKTEAKDSEYALNSSSSTNSFGFTTNTYSLSKTKNGEVKTTVVTTENSEFAVRIRGNSQSETKKVSKTKERKEKATDAALSIAARQKTWDDAIVVGELYKIGSAIAVCIDRTKDPFISNAENDPVGSGRSVEAKFSIVKGGTGNVVDYSRLVEDADEYKKDRRVATESPHLYRIALGEVTTTRECRNIEVGIKSQLGIRITGLCNFKDTLTYSETNDIAGRSKKGDIIARGDTLKTENYSSGVVTTAEDRYSFFRLSVKQANSSSNYSALSPIIGVKSSTQQPVFNTIRFEMPSTAQWQIRFEPLTGWEIRSGNASGTLYVLDNTKGSDSIVSLTTGLTAGTVGGGSVTIWFNGYSVSRSKSVFELNTTKRSQDIGIGHQDETNYADAWGRLAEAFNYDEITTSAQNGPEHEIVYVSEAVANASTPNYDNIALVGLSMRSTLEWSQLSQFSAYVLKGREVELLSENGATGSSNLFPDILFDLLTNNRFGTGAYISRQQIDIDSFAAADQWCKTRNYYFDGVIADRVNLRDWASEVAASNLLDFIQKSGKFALVPAVIFNTAVPIKALFTAGNIVKDSFSMEFLDEEDRKPIQVSVKWRQERTSTSLTAPASFPVEREVLVREASQSDQDPIESFDLSEYCTSLNQAIDFACYVIRVRRLITHTIKFSTTIDGLASGIGVGDYIRVALDYTTYDEFANGVVLSDGTLSTTRPDLLAAGTHNVTAWAGGDSNVYDTTLTVNAGAKTASPTGIVFVKKNTGTQVRTYKIESLRLDEQGVIEVEAVHHPTDSSGISEIGKNWTNYTTNSFWNIRRG